MTNTFSDQDQLAIRFYGVGVKVIAIELELSGDEDLEDTYRTVASALPEDLTSDVDLTLMVAEWRIIRDSLYRSQLTEIADQIETALAANGWVD